ncbi:hypothetical protein BDV96DRAFT_689284 [Lophiotrema nucula]|uniref:Uncharacterized protein n=1 Tax=Lophiotrema nucula TaxID=690887 RepID=A0A6A5Z274_9PLEO|nr:hypothetical protein BDV96DRAFT_689284 [Lophiotrema nucula]
MKSSIASGVFFSLQILCRSHILLSLSELPRYANPSGTGSKTPKGNGVKTSGSGPYPAQSFIDPTLPSHTIFAPKTPHAGNLSLPFIAWWNGGCTLSAASYENFLVEIASHGYVIAADGTPIGSQIPAVGSQSKVQGMRDSVD